MDPRHKMNKMTTGTIETMMEVTTKTVVTSTDQIHEEGYFLIYLEIESFIKECVKKSTQDGYERRNISFVVW